MTVLGIDPGVKQTGWAVINERLLLDCGTITGKPAEQSEYLGELARESNVALVVVQVPWTGGAAIHFHGSASKAAVLKNASIANYLVGFFAGQGRRVFAVPSTDCRAWGMKMKAKPWGLYWNWRGRTNEHERDAAQLALHGGRLWIERQRGKATVEALFKAVGAKMKEVKP